MTATRASVAGGTSADQRRLIAELARVRRRLLGEAGHAGEVPAEELAEGTALDALVQGFGLSPFERDVLLAAVAAELDPALPAPSFGVLLATLPGAHWSAILPGSPLRAARLVTPGDDGGAPLLAAPLRAEERILHHLQGVTTLDDRLAAYLVPVAVPSPAEAAALPASRREAAAALRRLWQGQGGDAARPAAVLVHGPDRADRREVVALAVGERALWCLPIADLPRATAERDGFARLWNREARLSGAVLLVEIGDGAAAAPEPLAAVESLLARLDRRVAVLADARLGLAGVAVVLEVARPSHAEQALLWRRVLPVRCSARAVAALADEFDLGHADILHPPVELHSTKDTTDPVALARSRSRDRIRQRLAGLAERIEPRAGWQDLVLPPAQHRLVRLLGATARGRRALHARGQGRVTDRGLGVAALFSGPSGTGKTLAAEAVARELGLDLHRVDLASVVSKWMGETEKHLRQVFDAAEQGGTVLLFDEADALFGKRSEVRDSHDRYANLEVSYLLQRMERYRGIAVLTTNQRTAIDPAFLRRLRFVVHFPHPDPELRRELWCRALPPDRSGTARAGSAAIDLDRLSRLDLTGGEIAAVASHARLLAGAARQPVGMEHLHDAVVAEFIKLERPLAGLEAWS